jgi:hypothetical protein
VLIKVLAESRARFFRMDQSHRYTAFHQIGQQRQKRPEAAVGVDVEVFNVSGGHPQKTPRKRHLGD